MERVNIKETGLFDGIQTQPRPYTNMIVCHHTGGVHDDDVGAETIHEWHLHNGWAGIGYHFVIRKDGSIERGRPVDAIGAHAYGDNSHSIGIHFCGNFDIGEPTNAQIESGAMLIANLITDFDLPCNSETIVGHRDLMSTACPGDNLYNQLETIIGKANWYANQ